MGWVGLGCGVVIPEMIVSSPAGFFNFSNSSFNWSLSTFRDFRAFMAFSSSRFLASQLSISWVYLAHRATKYCNVLWLVSTIDVLCCFLEMRKKWSVYDVLFMCNAGLIVNLENVFQTHSLISVAALTIHLKEAQLLFLTLLFIRWAYDRDHIWAFFATAFVAS